LQMVIVTFTGGSRKPGRVAAKGGLAWPVGAWNRCPEDRAPSCFLKRRLGGKVLKFLEVPGSLIPWFPVEYGIL
jgi:hypothetical protein